jgi:hypothetical protein
MEFQRAAFQLVGGVETKVSGISLGPPQLLRAENCFADKSGALRKRYGVTALSGLTVDNGATNQVAALARYKNSLMALEVSATPNVLEYSASASRWTEHGTYAPGVMLSQAVAAANGGGGIWQADVDVCGNYTLFATLEDGIDDGGTFNSTVRVTLQDAEGAFICHQMQVFSDGSGVSVAEKMNLRVVHLGTQFYVFFGDFTHSDIRVWLLDTATPATITAAIGTSGGGSAASSVLVAADLHVLGADLATFDVAPSSGNGIFLVYRTSTANQIKLGFVNAAGALASTSTLATTSNAFSLACAAQTAAIHGITYVGATGNLYAFHMSWSGAAWSTTSTSGVIDTGANVSLAIACRYDSNSVIRIWYGRSPLYQATYSTGGVAASRVVRLQRATLSSRPFAASDGKLYFWTTIGTTKQRTHFLVESATGLPMGRANFGVAEASLLSSVATQADGGMVAALLYIVRPVNGSLAFASGAVNIGVRAPAWYIDHPQSHRIVEVGESLIMGGAIPQQFDGVNFIEAGFLSYVDTSAIGVVKAGGGAMTAGAQYFFAVIEERTNARGVREFGTHSGVVSISMGGAETQVTYTIPANVMTRLRRTNTVASTAQIARQTSVFAIYRTDKNPLTSKAPLYRVGEVANDPTAATVTFVDTLADSSVVLNEELYLTSGEVDHTTPPAGHILCEGNGRVFIAGDPEHPLTVFPSLLRSFDEPVSFSDTIEIILPSAGGDITALAVLQESLIVFKERAIYRVSGVGPNNTESDNGAFGDPELISTHVGCVGQRSLVVTPFGVMFQSERGIHLLDNSLGLDYIGAPLEGLDAVDTRQAMSSDTVVLDAILLPELQQVRFAGAENQSGTIWVFDFYRKLWTVYTDTSVYGPSVVYENAHVFPGSILGLAAGTQVISEDATKHFTAATYLVHALIRPGGSAQDSMRFRKAGVTGEVFGGIGDVANVRLRLFPNNATVPVQTLQSPNLATSRAFRYHSRTGKDARVVSTLAVEVSDLDTFGAVGPCSVSINEIVLEMGPRQQALSRRVG